MRPLAGTNSSSKFLLSIQSSFAACRKGELLAIEGNAGTKSARERQQQPMGNARRQKAFSIALGWNKRRPIIMKQYGIMEQGWLKPMMSQQKRLLLRGYLGSAPAKITDEAIDQVLVPRKEIIKRNAQRQQESLLSILPSHSSNYADVHRYKDKHALVTSKKDELNTSKRKKAKARRLEKAIGCMHQKILHLQSEIHRKAAAFFTHEFDAIVIPFVVSDMMKNEKEVKTEELGVRFIIQNEAYTFKTF
ncbi:hypothetical protein G9A89_002736 [Geosiphon pyriformis]|nr:hypothetical protein G9A89_002736 [Geosiphon pyriformis]